MIEKFVDWLWKFYQLDDTSANYQNDDKNDGLYLKFEWSNNKFNRKEW